MIMTGDDRKETETPIPKASPAPAARRNAPTLGDFDPWADWKPQWHSLQKSAQKSAKPPRKGKRNAAQKNAAARAESASPHDIQETHSPTQTVTTRFSDTGRQESHQRRIVDARLWDSMSAPQQTAALDIARAFETMGKGLGYVTSNWQRIPGCRGPESASEMHSRLLHAYVDWTKRCHQEKISHSMVIDILVFGFTCRALDRDRRVRAGAARENLLAGLSLYCALRGWPDK